MPPPAARVRLGSSRRAWEVPAEAVTLSRLTSFLTPASRARKDFRMSRFDVCWLSALELARGVRRREYAPTELARLFLDAIAAFNPPLNAVVTVDETLTLAQAAEVERRLAGDEAEGLPLAGVPFLAKDLDNTAGMRTTFGSRLTADYVPRWDMFHVARLKAAGAVLLGKTNTPEDGAVPNTYNAVFGPTRNPWRLDCGPGGSSGGSAAAVAAGLAPLATGSDGGGSIRLPAALSGVIGFKPTFGLVPFGPKGIGVSNSIGHLGPIARTVPDAAAMLAAMAGGDERDRVSLPRPARLEAFPRRRPALRRVAFSVDLGYAPVAPETRRAFQDAIDHLAEAGWPLEEARPDFADPGWALDVLIAYEWGSVPFQQRQSDPAQFALLSDEVKTIAEARARLTLDDLWRASQARKALCVALGAFFDRYDLLLTPTLTRSACAVGRPWPPDAADPTREDRSLNALLYPFNLSGDPAATIPLGLGPEGLPIGLQLVGPRHADARLLAAAHAALRLLHPNPARPPYGVAAQSG